MAAQMRSILEDAMQQPQAEEGLFLTMLGVFAGLGGVELELDQRTDPARIADLGAIAVSRAKTGAWVHQVRNETPSRAERRS